MSAEFTAPAIANNYISSSILTNVTGSTIMLQLQNSTDNTSIVPTMLQLPVDESLLYNSVAISSTTPGDYSSNEYNTTIIQEYIDNGILSQTQVIPTPPTAYIDALPNSTHSLSFVNGLLSKKVTKKPTDLMEVFYSTTLGTLMILVYRGPTGFYYSLDNGSTIIPIPTTGMNYPDQVTSIAIQNIIALNNPSTITIWAGTLQEGLLAYTLGGSSWVAKVDKEQNTDGSFIFRNSLYTPVITNTLTTSYTYISLGYAPIYILGLVNNPQEAGLPIIVYVKSYIQQTTLPGSITSGILTVLQPLGIPASSIIGKTISGINIPGGITITSQIGTTNQFILSNNSLTGISTELITLTTSPDLYKTTTILYKFLSLNYYTFTQDTAYNIWRQTLTINTQTTWTPLPNPFTNEVFDVLKSIPYNFSQTSSGPLNNFSLITAVATFNSTLNQFITELVYISCTNAMNTAPRNISLTKDNIIGNTVIIQSQNFSGLSSFSPTPGVIAPDIFITEREKIWRYTNNSWNYWLISYDTSPNINLRIAPDYTFATPGSVSYISGLRGFGILQNTTQSSYLGILNTDFGHILFSLVPTSLDYMTINTSNAIVLRSDLCGIATRDLQIIPEINTAISCGLIAEPVTRYILSTTSFGPPTRYFNYSPEYISTLAVNTPYTISQIFYKNYTIGSDTLPFLINKYNDFDIITPNTDQLYLNQTNIAAVGILKELTNPINYNVSNTYFSWLPFQKDIDYVSFTMKYNRLYFLLQTQQTIPLVSTTLSSNLQMSFIPDASFQITT